ncbi:hypothetical protein B4U80_10518 [Leptotrombidium deliense]|uniref:Uncharacterized protein n=1 Tax=Leptotrombidium deliense TaxID=299467 RepID=A0A443RUV4_9ACAR|nr:hypothetical protein B4U80_10518 [Leptotrombidium deliense]
MFASQPITLASLLRNWVISKLKPRLSCSHCLVRPPMSKCLM